jgi:transposase
LQQERVDAMKKYVVELTVDEREKLEGMIRKGKVSARQQRVARILLKADQAPQGSGWSDKRIAQALEIGVRTVERMRERLVEEGLEAALKPKPQAVRFRKMDGKAEAHLIAQACSKPPQGRARWTLRMLAERMVELRVVDSVSHESVRQALKKTSLSLG